MWGFATRPARSLEVTPKHEELFRDADDIAESVTRETSQNSADAKADDSRGVRIRIARTALPTAVFTARWLRGLRPHMEAWKPGLTDSVFSSGEVECLLIEDFGTRGLEGDTDLPGGSFYAFWRQYGKSPKRGNTGGRHGEGKSTLAGASRARTFFGLTVRAEDGRRLLMGQAILGPHEIGGQRFEAYGEFSPTLGDEMPAPFEDGVGEPFFNGAACEEFARDFRLARASEPGLSLVVPAVRSEVVVDDLVGVKRALIANSFPQVASGLLAFDVEGDVLNAGTLEEWAARWPELHLSGAIAVAREAVNPTRVWSAAERRQIAPASFAEGELEEMRRTFATGELVSVRVPVTVKRIEGGGDLGAMLLHLRRCREGEVGSEHYARSRLTVPRQPKVLTGRDVIGLLMAEDGALSNFLGDAEPPSHARWTHQNLRDVARYRRTQDTLWKVANALRQLERLLQDEDAESINPDAFKALFSRPKPKPETERDPGATPPLDLPPRRAFWSVESRRGGFTVRRPDDVEVKDVDVEVAYMRRRGAPDWRETDFAFGRDIVLEATGEAEVAAAGNVIRISRAAPGFALTASGFDAHRDVVVLVRASDDIDA